VKRAIGAGLMDAGYYSETNVAELERRGIDPHAAPEGVEHPEEIPPGPRGRDPAGPPPAHRGGTEAGTQEGGGGGGPREGSERTGITEPIFGQLKQVLGFRQFALRGLAAMRSEWRLMCAVHNLLKLWRHTQAAVAG